LFCREGSCTAQVAHLTEDQGTFDQWFPETPVGSSSELRLQIENQGYADSEPINVTLTGDVEQFELAENQCQGQRLPPGERCQLKLIFKPTVSDTFHVDLHMGGGAEDLVHSFDTASNTVFKVSVQNLYPDNQFSDVRVLSDPPGIDCDERECSARFAFSTQITLTESHEPGMEFVGWESGGSCSGAGSSCSLNIDDTNYVVAQFKPWLTIEGLYGPGWVESDRGGLKCGEDVQQVRYYSCAATLTGPAVIVAHPEPGSSIGNWSGGCEAAGTSTECHLDVTGPVSFGVTFAEVAP